MLYPMRALFMAVRFCAVAAFMLLLSSSATAQKIGFVYTNIQGKDTAYLLHDSCAFLSTRLQATAALPSGTGKWEFLGINAADSLPTRDSVWRPFYPNQTLAAFNAVIKPVLEQPAALTVGGNAGFTGKLPAIVAGRYYTFNVREGLPVPFPGYDMAILETDYAPVTIDSVKVGKCLRINNPITIKVKVGAALHTGENVYICYSTDGFMNASVDTFTVVGQYGTHTFAANAFSTTATQQGNEVGYFVFTSNVPRAQITAANAELLSLNIARRNAGNCKNFTLKILPALVALPYASGAYGSGKICFPNSGSPKLASPLNFVGSFNGSGAAVYTWTRPTGATFTGTPLVIVGNTITTADSGLYALHVVETTTGCQGDGTTNFIITKPIEPNIFATNAQCTPIKLIGTMQLSPTGGVPPYTYYWSDSSKTVAIAVPAKGIRTVTVTDAGGCSATQSAAIPAGVISVDVTTIVPQCFGQNTGAATATASSFAGSAAAVQYKWSNGPTTKTVNNLTPGNIYTVTVTDVNGCTSSLAIKFPGPAQAINPVVTTYRGCKGLSNGRATVVVTGGSRPYTYTWNTTPVQTAATATGLATYTPYKVLIKDARNCRDSVTGILIDTMPVGFTVVSSQVPSCNGGKDGIVTIRPTDSTATPATYTWFSSTGTNLGNNKPVLTNVADTYTVSMTAANGCKATGTAVISISTTALQITPTITPTNGTNNLKCSNDRNGAISIATNNGTAPYRYAWSPNTPTTYSGSNNTGNTVRSLAGGTYTVSVTDMNGCTAVRAITVTQPPVGLAVSLVPTGVRCKGEKNGAIQTLSIGGQNLTCKWIDDPTATCSRTNLNGGTYLLISTDPATGCQSSDFVTVTEAGNALSATIGNIQAVKCFGDGNGGACIAPAGGVSPYTYKWATAPVATTACVNNLEGGTLPYFTTVTDANGCTTTASVVVPAPIVPFVLQQLTTIQQPCGATCNGKLQFTPVNGVKPYNQYGAVDTIRIAGLCAGDTTFTVTDHNGCVATIPTHLDSVHTDIHALSMAIEKGKNAQLAITTTTQQPYSIRYFPTTAIADTTVLSTTASPDVTTDYSIRIFKSGCTSSATFRISLLSRDGIHIPNAFAPESGGPSENNTFAPIIVGTKTVLTAFKVFNRWGQVVHDNINTPWDGTFNGTPQPTGSYIYLVMYSDDNATIKQLSGDVTLIR